MLVELILLSAIFTSFQVLITNGDLELVDEGVSYIIRTDKEILDKYVVFLYSHVFESHSVAPAWTNGARKRMERFVSPYLYCLGL